MKLTKTEIREIILGSTVLGTGGGGRYDSALETIKDVTGVELISLNDLGTDDIAITAYGAGGLTKPRNTNQVVRNGFKLLQQNIGKPISAIVPVEIGPYSLAAAFMMASDLGVPVVDGDLVGCRSVPEIYIELVTLAGLPRTPLVCGNNAGDRLLIDQESSPESLEATVRSFADRSESNVFVLGYPYTKAQLERCLAEGSVLYGMAIEEKLRTDFEFVAAGTVSKDVKSEIGGFTQGQLIIKGEDAEYTVLFKNEYMVLLKNNKLIVTCPDFICVRDVSTGRGLNNGDDNAGLKVEIYIRPALKAWRTANGMNLFSPQKLGFSYNQKVMRQQ